MTAVLPSDSSSSFSSVPSEGSNFSHPSLLALAAAAAAVGGSVTPSKSLTPRYTAIHCPTAGVAQVHLPPQRAHQQRREPRHRFVEGGAPAEKYLEPLPQHIHLPPHHQVYQQHSNSTCHGGVAQQSPQTSARSVCFSPSFRQLPGPASPVSTTACSSPTNLVQTLNHHVLCGSHNPNSHHSPPQQGSSNSESCMSLRPLHIGPGSGVIYHAPFSGALALDSVTSRGLPSPLTTNLNPASPQLPRPPSLSDRTPNPRRSCGSVSPQRPLTVRPPSQAGDEFQGRSSEDENGGLAQILGTYYGGIQKVDSVVLPRVSSLLQQSCVGGAAAHQAGGGCSVSPPSQPMCPFRRQTEDDEDVESAGSSSPPRHGSPYSSFRLDGSQWEVPSPRVTSSTFTDALALRNSPQAQGMMVSQLDISACSPVNRTPTAGSPRTLGFSLTVSPSSSSSRQHHQLFANAHAPPYSNHHQNNTSSSSGATIDPSAHVGPSSFFAFDGHIRFIFQPRDGACTVDSLEDEGCASGQHSPRTS